MVREHGAPDGTGGHGGEESEGELAELEVVMELRLFGLVQVGGEAELVLAIAVDEVEGREGRRR